MISFFLGVLVTLLVISVLALYVCMEIAIYKERETRENGKGKN